MVVLPNLGSMANTSCGYDGILTGVLLASGATPVTYSISEQGVLLE